MESEKVLISFLLPPEIANKLKEEAKRQNKKVSVMLREWCENLFKEEAHD